MHFYKPGVLLKVGLFLLGLVFLNSCVSRKEIAYFQNAGFKPTEPLDKKINSLRLKPNDLVTINVSAPEQDAAIPFNLPLISSGNTDLGSSSMNAAPRLQNYLVDSDGFIYFPILGKYKVEGMNLEELRNRLVNDISNYVKDPIVTVQLVNFQVSVLGEVNRPGTFTVNDQYISLPNALGLAGDLSIYGRRDNILIIREEDDQVKKTYLDITNSNIVNSPYYYLKQNDVVYVEPNKSQRQGASFNRNTGIYVSVASVLISLVVLFTK